MKIPHEEHCSFCAYLALQRPYTIVSRNETTAVLVTREQRGSPHVLVIPVRHAETLLDLDDHEVAALAVAVRRTAASINRVFSPNGIAIWQNNGVAAHQSIPHVHFHVAGTLPGGGTDWGKVPELDLQQTEAIASKLRADFDD